MFLQNTVQHFFNKSDLQNLILKKLQAFADFKQHTQGQKYTIFVFICMFSFSHFEYQFNFYGMFIIGIKSILKDFLTVRRFNDILISEQM